MKRSYIFFMAAIAALLTYNSSCINFPDRKYTITIVNNSTHRIRFYFDGLTGAHYYPDTVLPAVMPPMGIIEPGKRFYRDAGIKWEDTFREMPSDTLSLYVFHPDTLNVYDWPTIRNRYKILKRYDLSIEDLQRADFTISYP
jgi:hypothetical protein